LRLEDRSDGRECKQVALRGVEPGAPLDSIMARMTPLAVVLAPGSLNHTANIIKGFAIAIGIAIAIYFVWMWWSHRQRERRIELAARARAVYAASLRTAVAHPEMAEPMLGALNNQVEIVRYKQFVASLLAGADEILTLDPSPAWRDTLARQLTPHRSYLASEEFQAGGLQDCTAEVQALVRRATGA
jgi:hypothetical protein